MSTAAHPDTLVSTASAVEHLNDLGFPSVRNYDGSWTERGNIVGAPIELDVPVTASAQACVA